MTTAEIFRPAFTAIDKAAAELRALLDAPRDNGPGRERDRSHRIRELRSQLCREYARRNDWIVAQTEFHPGQLARQSNQTTRAEQRDGWWSDHPAIDHSSFMRHPGSWRLPAAIISQPYHFNPATLDNFCTRWNLHGKVETDFPSWWLPGSTTMLVFTPKPRT